MIGQSHRILILLVGGIILNIALLGAYWWLWGIIHTKANDTSRIALELADVGAKTTEEQSLLDFVERTSEQRDVLERRFVTDETFIAFLEDIENLARETGVKLDSTVSDLPTHIEMSLRTTASFSDTIRYLRLLETMPTGAVITRFSTAASRVQATDGGTLWDSVIVVRVLNRNSGENK